MGQIIDFNALLGEDIARKEEQARGKWAFDFADDVNEDFEPVRYVCEELGIAPGPVTILGGTGFGGKTVTAQALLLAVATGKKAFGQFEVQQGPVRHFDFEQGKRVTYTRYKRLARAMGVDLKETGKNLGVSCTTGNSFTDSLDSENELSVVLRDVKLAVIDPFRCAFPTADENDSGARKYLDMLHRVSNRTGCAIVIIAHSRKTGKDADVRTALRGTSALFDAAQTVLMLEGQEGKPTRVTMTKERLTGQLRKPFGLRVVDVPDPALEGGNRWGLDVEYVDPLEMSVEYMDRAPNPDQTVAMNAARMSTLGGRVLDLLGNDSMLATTIRAMLHPASMTDTTAVLNELVMQGHILREGKGSTALYSLCAKR